MNLQTCPNGCGVRHENGVATKTNCAKYRDTSATAKVTKSGLVIPKRRGDAARQRAVEHDQAAAESFERSDTDGALTQWSHGVSAQKERLQARIDDNGGTWEFPALFDLDGNMVPAKLIDTQYGSAFALLESDDPSSSLTGKWINPSNARSHEVRNRNMRKKGYTIGTVRAPARAELSGSGTGLSGALSVTAYARRVYGDTLDDGVEVVRTEQGPEDDAWQDS